MKRLLKRLWFLWVGTEGLEAMLAKSQSLLSQSIRECHDWAVKENRLRNGLENIAAHAAAGTIPAGSNGLLRDYCREVLDNTQAKSRQHDTEGVSAAQRWGYDFTKEPGDKTPPPRIRRN